jgi:hypothetical protein
MTGAGPYSPSQTATWLLCPELWRLGRQYLPRDRRASERAVGTGIHTGLSRWLTGTDQPQATTLAIQAGLARLQQESPEEDGAPVEIQIDKGMRLAYSHDWLAGGELIASEVAIDPIAPGSTQPARADLVIGHGTEIMIVDCKVRTQLFEYRVQGELDSTIHSWQLKHYAWAWERDHPEHTVTRVSQVFIVLGPRAAVYPYVWGLTGEDIRQWLASASIVWDFMRHGIVWRNLMNCQRYGGKCAFWSACHVLHGQNLESVYERRNDAIPATDGT